MKSSSKTKKCAKCLEEMKETYRVCPRCGDCEYKKGELEKAIKAVDSMRKRKLKHPATSRV